MESKLVNLGSVEKPVYVTEQTLQAAKDDEWWQMVAEGAVALTVEQLDALLALRKSETGDKE